MGFPASTGQEIKEYANLAAFPVAGSSGIIYLALDTLKQYIWSGSAYVILVGAVASVAGRTGAITLTLADVGVNYTPENVANKDATSGYAGLTATFGINFKNAANTFTNLLTNTTTAARNWVFPDKDGTVAMTSDLSSLLPYTGATSDIDTGIYGVKTNDALIGADANFTDFPNAKFMASQGNTGETHTYNAGIVGEGIATLDTVSRAGVGIYGTGATNGTAGGYGVIGDARVTSSGDEGESIGLLGYATNTHAGGINYAAYLNAAGGALNYALAMVAGNIISFVDQTWKLKDNSATSLSWNTTGKNGILAVDTTDGSEKVTMSGGLNVTGAASASNISGTNTGDITLTTIGATPTANGASLSGQVLTLQPASASFGGVVTTSAQVFAGDKTFGTAAAATNIIVNINGVASKAARVAFQQSGVDKWLLGNGAASENNKFELYNTAGTVVLSVDPTTSVSTFGAGLALPAGTATANTAPLKLTSGTLNTTPEAGAVEFLTDNYYVTVTTGAVRKAIVLREPTVFTAISSTILTTQENIEVTASGTTQTLYTAVGNDGKIVRIDNSSAGDTTILSNGGLLWGETSQTLPTNSTFSFRSNGTDWRPL